MSGLMETYINVFVRSDHVSVCVHQISSVCVCVCFD